MKQQQTYINDQIRGHTVIVIGSDGSKKGQFTRFAAIQMARDEGLDLVLVSPGQGSNPPICRIADFGKMQYERSKSVKKNTHQPEQKEMWFTPKTAQADLDRKVKQVIEWLAKQHKVLIGVELKGRERFDQNQRKLVREMVSEIARTMNEQASPGSLSEGGKSTSMLLSPRNA